VGAAGRGKAVRVLAARSLRSSLRKRSCGPLAPLGQSSLPARLRARTARPRPASRGTCGSNPPQIGDGARWKQRRGPVGDGDGDGDDNDNDNGNGNGRSGFGRGDGGREPSRTMRESKPAKSAVCWG